MWLRVGRGGHPTLPRPLGVTLSSVGAKGWVSRGALYQALRPGGSDAQVQKVGWALIARSAKFSDPLSFGSAQPEAARPRGRSKSEGGPEKRPDGEAGSLLRRCAGEGRTKGPEEAPLTARSGWVEGRWVEGARGSSFKGAVSGGCERGG